MAIKRHICLGNFTKMLLIISCIQILSSFFPEYAKANSCDASLARTTLVIQSGTIHRPCESVCKLKIDHLHMEMGSVFIVPPKCASFELDVNKSVFDGENIFIADAAINGSFRKPAGRTGIPINLIFNSADLNFSPQQSAPKEQAIGRLYFQLARIFLPSILSPAPPPGLLPKLNTKGLDGVVIISRGEAGAQGSQGAKGAAAKRKTCQSGSGKPAGNGLRGQTGQKGGVGGDIYTKISVASDSRTSITQNDVNLLSLGGFGGAGGIGGFGGDGSSARGCGCIGSVCAYKRSAYSPGNPGPSGSIGPIGDAGNATIDISLN